MVNLTPLLRSGSFTGGTKENTGRGKESGATPPDVHVFATGRVAVGGLPFARLLIVRHTSQSLTCKPLPVHTHTYAFRCGR